MESLDQLCFRLIRRLSCVLDSGQLDHPLGANSDIVVEQALQRSFIHIEVIAEGIDFGEIGLLIDMVDDLINKNDLFILFGKLGSDQLLRQAKPLRCSSL